MTICSFFETRIIPIFSLLDYLNRIVIPFSLMIVSLFLLIKLLLNSNESQTNKNLTIGSIVLNVANISLTMPIILKSFFSMSGISLAFASWIFYSSYAVNFYIIIFTHPLVLNRFLILFRLRSSTNETIQIRYTHIQHINTESNINLI